MADVKGIFARMAHLMEPDDIRYPALMTAYQFQALHLYVESEWSDQELESLAAKKKPGLPRTTDPNSVARWLFNAWGTEYLLRESARTLADDISVGLQWAFPQAYYAIFAQLQAWHEASGTILTSHAKLRSTFARDVEDGKYPACLSFYALGGRKGGATLHNMEQPSRELPSIQFSAGDPETWRHQLWQFLRSTRTKSLESSREKRRKEFKTQKGEVKKRLTSEEWKRLSDTCHATTALDLVYRKRIKSNYEDVSIFSAASMNARPVYDALVGIVSRFACVHESFVASRDPQLYSARVADFEKRCDAPFLQERMSNIVGGS